MSRSRFSLNIGGFGVNVGKCAWDVLAQKYDINFDGSFNKLEVMESAECLDYFSEKSSGKCRAIGLFIDMDFEAIEAIQTSYLKALFDEVR